MQPTYDELLEENRQLKEIIKRLEMIIAEQASRIAELESRLNKNSKNSSKSPSSDQKPNLLRRQPKEQRPFHPGASRQLLPENRLTSLEQRKIEICPRCDVAMESTGRVLKWQQVELPEIRPLVHQIECLGSRCPRCSFETLPALSESEKFLLSPRLEAFVHLCLSQFRQGHEVVREFLNALLPDLTISKGLISKIKARGDRAFKQAREEIRLALSSHSGATHMDATSWRHSGKNEHAIVTRSDEWVLFDIVGQQNGDTIANLVEDGEVDHLVTDRGFPAQKLKVGLHQYCLAHLLRNILGLAEHRSTSLNEVEDLGELYDLILELFHDKHRLDRSEISEGTWRQYGYQTWNDIRYHIEEKLASSSKKTRRFYKKLLSDLPHFKAYLRSRDHPMTNNPAEEALRPLVIARKLCFGSRSEYGKEWRASLQSCIATLRKKNQDVWDFLTQVVRAYRSEAPYPRYS